MNAPRPADRGGRRRWTGPPDQGLHRIVRLLTRHRRTAAAVLAAAATACLLAALRPASPPTVTVLAADRDLPGGATLAAADLTTVSLPPGSVPAGALRPGAAVAGRVLAAPVRRGEPLTDVRLLGPDSLTGYGPGLVAAPVRIADAGSVRLLRPGDRVDVLAAAPHDGAITPATTVAADLRVVAVPRADELETPEDGALVVLAARPEQAAGLAGSAASTRLSITIRPSARPSADAPPAS